MKISRDSIIWWVGIVGAIATGLAMNFDMFPWIPDHVQHWISLLAFVFGIVSGKLATSPLPGKDDAPRVDPTKIGAAVLLLASLTGGLFLLTGCAHNPAPSTNPQVVQQQRVLKVLHAVEQIGVVVEQVQIAEGNLYAAGDVPQATHDQIAKAFAETSAAVIAATTALRDTSTATDPRTVVQAVNAGLQSLAQTFLHLNAKQSRQLAGWLDTASALVELALS